MPNKLDCDSVKLAVRISWKANEQTYIIYIYIHIYIYYIYYIYTYIYIYIYICISFSKILSRLDSSNISLWFEHFNFDCILWIGITLAILSPEGKTLVEKEIKQNKRLNRLD